MINNFQISWNCTFTSWCLVVNCPYQCIGLHVPFIVENKWFVRSSYTILYRSLAINFATSNCLNFFTLLTSFHVVTSTLSLFYFRSHNLLHLGDWSTVLNITSNQFSIVCITWIVYDWFLKWILIISMQLWILQPGDVNYLQNSLP